MVVLARLGQLDGAAQLFGAIDHSGMSFGSELEDAMSRARSALGEEPFDHAVVVGASLGYYKAGELALRLIDQALTALR